MRSGASAAARHIPSESGFVMIEAVIATGLVALGVGTVMAAIVMVQHQTASGAPAAALTLSAQNVLTDIRAASAYDADEFAALAGRTSAFDLTEPAPLGGAQPLHVVVHITGATAGVAAVAAVSVRNARGQTATVQGALVQEAPAPGSTVSTGTAAASAAPAAASTPAARDAIAL